MGIQVIAAKLLSVDRELGKCYLIDRKVLNGDKQLVAKIKAYGYNQLDDLSKFESIKAKAKVAFDQNNKVIVGIKTKCDNYEISKWLCSNGIYLIVPSVDYMSVRQLFTLRGEQIKYDDNDIDYTEAKFYDMLTSKTNDIIDLNLDANLNANDINEKEQYEINVNTQNDGRANFISTSIITQEIEPKLQNINECHDDEPEVDSISHEIDNDFKNDFKDICNLSELSDHLRLNYNVQDPASTMNYMSNHIFNLINATNELFKTRSVDKVWLCIDSDDDFECTMKHAICCHDSIHTIFDPENDCECVYLKNDVFDVGKLSPEYLPRISFLAQALLRFDIPFEFTNIGLNIFKRK